MKKRIVLWVQGGAGDVLVQTTMIRAMRRSYWEDEIIVLATYADLLKHNPDIDELIPLKTPGEFYSNRIAGQDIRFFRKRFAYDYLLDEGSDRWALGQSHIAGLQCAVFGVEWDGKGPEYYPTKDELRGAQAYLDQYTRPVILLHATTSIASEGNGAKSNSLKDIPIDVLGELVFRNRNQAHFLQIGLKGEPVIPGAVDVLGAPLRDTLALLACSHGAVVAESVFGHALAALKKRGVVLFQSTSPKFYGWDSNINIYPYQSGCLSGGCPQRPCNRPHGALVDYGPFLNIPGPHSRLWDCPEQKCNQWNVEEIESALKRVLRGEP